MTRYVRVLRAESSVPDLPPSRCSEVLRVMLGAVAYGPEQDVLLLLFLEVLLYWFPFLELGVVLH